MAETHELVRRITQIGRVKQILRHHLGMLWSDPARAASVPPLMIWGPPGVGKSALIRQVADETGSRRSVPGPSIARALG
jgi:Holliday junction resolvasome RuvABC ATP-dependent DNA helicase subunit